MSFILIILEAVEFVQMVKPLLQPRHLVRCEGYREGYGRCDRCGIGKSLPFGPESMDRVCNTRTKQLRFEFRSKWKLAQLHSEDCDIFSHGPEIGHGVAIDSIDYSGPGARSILRNLELDIIILQGGPSDDVAEHSRHM